MNCSDIVGPQNQEHFKILNIKIRLLEPEKSSVKNSNFAKNLNFERASVK